MHSDYYGAPCECSKGHEFKNLLRMILEVRKETAELENKIGIANSTNEYLKMIALGDRYIPPIESLNKCDFVLIGNEMVCNHCHANFDSMDGFIPPFCPFCFASSLRNSYPSNSLVF